MNSKTTLWLMAISVGLFGYIYVAEWRTTSPLAETGPAQALLPSFVPGRVSSIEIIRTNETIRAEQVRDRWHLTTPPYPAQSTAIGSFVSGLTNLTRQHQIPAQEIIAEAGGLSPFGLDPPSAIVKLQAGTNLFQFRVGAKTLVGDGVYVQPTGASGIFTTDAALLAHLPANANQWRDPLLVHQPNASFDRIAITAAGQPLKLERDATNQLWRLVDPMPTRADFARVEDLLLRLRSARAVQFVTDDPKADVEAYGLQTPEAVITLASGSNTVFQLQFGKALTNDPTLVYARPMDHTNVVTVSRELAELVERPYTEFRDRSLISFRPALVQRIEAQADEPFALQRGQSNEWQIVEPFQAPADPQLMQLFVEDLAKLEIIHFEKEVVTDFSPFGLVTPARRYVLKSAMTNGVTVTNQTLAQIEFGAIVGSNQFDRVYCRRSDERSVYVVPSAQMLNLPRAAFLLRDRQIWRFAASNVITITISQQGQKRELTRDNESKTWVRNDQVLNAAIEETLHRLGQLHADNWVAIGQDQTKLLQVDGSRYQLTLGISEGGRSRKLTLNLRLGNSGQPYGAVVLEQNQPVVFRFPVQLYGMVMPYLSVPSVSAEP